MVTNLGIGACAAAAARDDLDGARRGLRDLYRHRRLRLRSRVQRACGVGAVTEPGAEGGLSERGRVVVVLLAGRNDHRSRGRRGTVRRGGAAAVYATTTALSVWSAAGLVAILRAPQAPQEGETETKEGGGVVGDVRRGDPLRTEQSHPPRVDLARPLCGPLRRRARALLPGLCERSCSTSGREGWDGSSGALRRIGAAVMAIVVAHHPAQAGTPG